MEAAHKPLTPGRALLYGTLVVGAIDFVYATGYFVLTGRPWYRVWQHVACGVLGAFFVMTLVVVPLTRIGRQPFVWSAFSIGGLLVHAFLLGPAAAYFARRVGERHAF